MKDILCKINYILNKRQKCELVFLCFCMIVNAFLEMLGISCVYPIIDIAVNPNSINSNKIYSYLYVKVGVNSYKEFVLVVIIVMIFVIVLKTLFIIFFNWYHLRFKYKNRRILSVKMLEIYIRQPYSFFIKNNSASLIQSIDGDTDFFFRCLFDITQIIVYCFTASCIGIFMFLSNTMLTTSVIGAVLFFLCIHHFLVKKRILKYGEDYRFFHAKMLQWLKQSLEGVKETKIFKKESFFIVNYNNCYKEVVKASLKMDLLSSAMNSIFLSICR